MTQKAPISLVLFFFLISQALLCSLEDATWLHTVNTKHPVLHSGWSVLSVSKLLHNAVKHYNYPALQSHWRICSLGVLSSCGVWEMMALGAVDRERERETGTEMTSRETVNQLATGTRGEKQSGEKRHLPDGAAAVGR